MMQSKEGFDPGSFSGDKQDVRGDVAAETWQRAGLLLTGQSHAASW
jgi:hypothetical protein